MTSASSLSANSGAAAAEHFRAGLRGADSKDKTGRRGGAGGTDSSSAPVLAGGADKTDSKNEPGGENKLHRAGSANEQKADRAAGRAGGTNSRGKTDDAGRRGGAGGTDRSSAPVRTARGDAALSACPCMHCGRDLLCGDPHRCTEFLGWFAGLRQKLCARCTTGKTHCTAYPAAAAPGIGGHVYSTENGTEDTAAGIAARGIGGHVYSTENGTEDTTAGIPAPPPDYRTCVAWLKGYRTALRRENELALEVKRLRAEAAYLAPLLEGTGGHTAPDPDRLPRAVEGILRAETRLSAQISSCQRTRAAVSAAVDRVPEPREHEILRRRYLLCQTFEDIARDALLDERWARRLHRRAVEHLILTLKSPLFPCYTGSMKV
jgi:hypothetical protein